MSLCSVRPFIKNVARNRNFRSVRKCDIIDFQFEELQEEVINDGELCNFTRVLVRNRVSIRTSCN